MLDKGMSQKAFASELCIAEATLSGIFNGRTRPTNLTVNAIHERFPDVNISWLMFGEGDMYLPASGEHSASTGPSGADGHADAQQHQDAEADLFSFSRPSDTMPGVGGPMADANGTIGGGMQMTSTNMAGNVHAAMPPKIQYIEKYIDRPQRKITEIRIFFDDGTYETFTP